MFTDFQGTELFPITGADIIRNILVAMLCGLSIAWLYRRTYKGPGYSVSFVNALVLLSMITAMVMLTIGNNLARAFGLVGAMSIIRFRTAVKDTQDIVYIFFALAVGMAAGVGYHRVAIIGTLTVGFMIFCFSKTKAAAPQKDEYLLQFSYNPNGDDVPAYVSVLRRYCRSHHVINTRALGADREELEISCYVQLRDKQGDGHFVREMRRASGVGHVNLFSDEEQF